MLCPYLNALSVDGKIEVALCSNTQKECEWLRDHPDHEGCPHFNE